MSAVPHIPDEIFVEILSSLPSGHIAPVCLVSRRLYSIAQPLLYKEPVLHRRNSYPSSLRHFLRTLLTPACETLGTHVRRLTLSWRFEGAVLDDRDHGLFIAAVSRFGLHDRLLSSELLVMLVLHLLPHLQFLHLLPPGNSTWFYRKFIEPHYSLWPSAITPVALQSLREFKSDRPTLLGPKALLVLLRLPRIRTVTAAVCGDIELQLPKTYAVAGANTAISTVTALTLPFARMPLTSFSRILQIPVALTYFSYRTLQTDGDAFDLQIFWLALRPLRGSLQTLVLNFAPLVRTRTDEDSATTTEMHSLREWHALRNLSCSLLPLLGRGPREPALWHLADVLPAGIRNLEVLRDRYWSTVEAVHEIVVLLEQKEVVVPRLESVVVDQSSLVCELEEQLEAACTAAGVLSIGDSTYWGDGT